MNHPESRSKWWQKLLIDEDRRSPASRCLATNEDGMVVLAAIATVLFLLVLLGLLGNVLLVVHQKMEVQSAADAVAGSVSVQMARGLNTVTTINHLMGEILGLVVVHDAIGGERLPTERLPPEEEKVMTVLDVALRIAHGKLQVTGEKGQAFDNVIEKVRAEAALLPSWKRLKAHLTAVYLIMAIGSALEKSIIPIVSQVGTVILNIGRLFDYYIWAESVALKALDSAARATEGAIRSLFDDGLREARRLAEQVHRDMPQLVSQTAEQIARQHGVTVALYPQQPRLPLVDDPLSRATDENQMDRSQAVRACWPWVVYHRKPLLDITGWMVFSQFRKFYREETEKYTRRQTYQLYRKGHYLFVLEEMNPEAKGQESWATGDSRRLDRLFGVMAFTHRKSVEPVSGAFFPKGKQGGTVAFAQALVYNANPQQPSSGSGEEQPVIGWDTLNWHRQDSIFEFANPGSGSSAPWPGIRQNWQTKLVPVSMLREAMSQLPSEFRSQMGRVDPTSPLARTH